MKKPKPTQEEIFLAWCEKHGIKFSTHKAGEDCIWYNLNPGHKATLVVQGVTLKLNPHQDRDAIKVYFVNGEWSGGTNTIWNTNLPWEDK